MKRIKFFLFSFMIQLAVALPIGAASDSPANGSRPDGVVPSQLLEWKEWLLADHPASNCPLRSGTASNRDCVASVQCHWPTSIAIQLEESGARFEYRFEQFHQLEQPVLLPGNQKFWPYEVKINGHAGVVSELNEYPVLFLGPGYYTVTGVWSWDKEPAQLDIPNGIGRAILTRDGKNLPVTLGKPRRVAATGSLTGMANTKRPFNGSDRQTSRGLERCIDDGSGGVAAIPLLLQSEVVEKDAVLSNTLKVEVFRKLKDGIPLTLETDLRVTVSGETREVRLGRILPPQSDVIQLHSALPARIDSQGDGVLRLQVKPGQHKITLVSRYWGEPDSFRIEVTTPDWPDYEYWSFQRDDRLRTVEIEGVESVDVSLLEIPVHWRGYPTFRLDSESRLTLVTQQRGDVSPANNKLQLHREIWLDFDGQGYTVKDRVEGQMHQQWRLDARSELQLGRAEVQGRPVLITEVDGRSGVEIRQQQVDVKGVSRMEQALTFFATGWLTDVDQLSAALHLPPGWRLLHLGGADKVSGSWIDQWSLWDLFLCLITIVAVKKVLGLKAATVATAFLFLSYHEVGVPRVTWIVLVSLIALLPFVVRPLWRRLLGSLVVIGFLMVISNLVSFAVDQFRLAIYPQMEMSQVFQQERHRRGELLPTQESVIDAPNVSAQRGETMAEMMISAEADASAFGDDRQIASQRESGTLSQLAKVMPSSPYQSVGQAYPGSGMTSLSKRRQFDPYQVGENDRIQTGPGVPMWQSKKYRIVWSGPVGKEQEVSLYYSPPVVTASWRVATVLLSLLLLVFYLQAFFTRVKEGPGVKKMPEGLTGAMQGKGGLSAFLIGLPFLALFSAVVTIGSSPALATVNSSGTMQFERDAFPSQALLDEYERRLLKLPSCLPHCVAFNKGALTVSGSSMEVVLQPTTAATLATPIPTPTGVWRLQRLELNGKPLTSYRRTTKGFIEVQLPKGAHQLVMQGEFLADKIKLSFPQPVHNFEATIEGWQHQGLVDGRVPSRVIEMKRSVALSKAQTLTQPESPPFVTIDRRLTMGLRWQLETVVTRVAPRRAAFNMEIPLLAEENVLQEGIEIDNQIAKLRFVENQSVIRWSSSIKPQPSLTWKAQESNQWVERWRVDPSALWHLDYEGLNPVKESKNVASSLRPLWKPWGGEQVTLRFDRPKGIAGETQTIERAEIGFRPGRRLTTGRLDLDIRTGQGGEFAFSLPEQSQVNQITLDGQQLNRPEDESIRVNLKPGRQSFTVEWEQPTDEGVWISTPALQLPVGISNISIKYELPYDQWPLYLNGPLVGPAMLYWGVLCVILLVAVAATHAQRRLQLDLPVGLLGWLLLGLGLSTVLHYGLIPLLLAFFLLGLRRRHFTLIEQRLGSGRGANRKYNLMQFSLICIVISALMGLVIAVPKGLLSAPEMIVAGNGSSAYLYHWFQDRSVDGTIPSVSVVSVPIFTYRLVMLVWSLWVATRLIHWAVWGWGCLNQGGLWRSNRKEPSDADSNL